MGSHKTAEALIVRYQHLERGYHVLLLKPTVDTRDDNKETGVRKLRSRIGIEADCIAINKDDDLFVLYKEELAKCTNDSNSDFRTDYPVVIVDEAQFLEPNQVTQLRLIVDHYKHAKVYCYGLRTDSNSFLFPGSQRLFELADEISEIESVCKCGKKAIVTAKIRDGNVVLDTAVVDIGGDSKYRPMCFSCWNKRVHEATDSRAEWNRANKDFIDN